MRLLFALEVFKCTFKKGCEPHAAHYSPSDQKSTLIYQCFVKPDGNRLTKMLLKWNDSDTYSVQWLEVKFLIYTNLYYLKMYCIQLAFYVSCCNVCCVLVCFVQVNVRMSVIFRTAAKHFVRVGSWKLIFVYTREKNHSCVLLQVRALLVYSCTHNSFFNLIISRSRAHVDPRGCRIGPIRFLAFTV